ncbi:MAG: malectin domain-containing carbohydrate-binding protein, partial [Armatimonadota bacterium]
NTGHQPGANALGTNFVCTSDAVYVAYGDKCLRLDPATGETLSEFRLPGAPTWGYIGIYGDLLIAGASPVIFAGKETPGGKDNWDATSSKQLVVMDRSTGKVLWSFDSTYCFRHNAIVAGAGKVFCIDLLPDRTLEQAERRGETAAGQGKLVALDARTGEVVWSTDQDVFGTWLSYSEEHDILLQAGRPGRDMLPNEPADRMITYRGTDGTVVWDKRSSYSGPCMLHGDSILTQGSALSLLTGDPLTRSNPITGADMPWRWTRNYGCNYAVASQNLITFRSAAAGYFDLVNGSGTGNLGGFKSGCTSNLIVANGVLNAPDYTRTCTCKYQNQTSLAFVHDPEVEMWTFNNYELGGGPVKRVGINLGAPGDRMSDDGTLWLDYPSVGGPSPTVPVQVAPEEPDWFRWHSSRVQGEGRNWVAASGAKAITRMSITLAQQGAPERAYTVRLHFVEPDGSPPGQRVFDVALQGNTVLRGLDIAKEAGGPKRPLVKELTGVKVRDVLSVSLKPRSAAPGRGPVLCGIEVVAEG